MKVDFDYSLLKVCVASDGERCECPSWPGYSSCLNAKKLFYTTPTVLHLVGYSAVGSSEATASIFPVSVIRTGATVASREAFKMRKPVRRHQVQWNLNLLLSYPRRIQVRMEKLAARYHRCRPQMGGCRTTTTVEHWVFDCHQLQLCCLLGCVKL